MRLVLKNRPFERALGKAFSDTATRAVSQHREEYEKILKSNLLDTEGPRYLGGEFLPPSDEFIRTLGLAWFEIIESAQMLEAIPKYLRKEQGRPASITAVQHLRYHFEHYLHEVYILRERLRKFLKIVQRKYRREDLVRNTINKLDGLVLKSFEWHDKARGHHVHSERFRDPDLKRLKMFELLASGKRGFRAPLRSALRDVRRKKLELIKSTNYEMEKLLNEYCRELYSIVFDTKGNLRFPPGVKAA